MNPKILAIAALLRDCGEGFHVHHEYVRGFYNFRMEGKDFTHQLHIPWKLVHEWNEQIIERLIKRPDCFERLAAATQATYLCLLEIGARDVGEDFMGLSDAKSGKGRAEPAVVRGTPRCPESAQGRLQRLRDAVQRAQELGAESRHKS